MAKASTVAFLFLYADYCRTVALRPTVPVVATLVELQLQLNSHRTGEYV